MSIMTFIILCGIASLIYGVVTGRSIMAAPAGDKVYVVASTQAEPPSLWEYNLAARRLRKLGMASPRPGKKRAS